MKIKSKKYRISTFVLVALYVVYVVCLFWFHPFVASAKESDSEKVVGGKNNKVNVSEVIHFIKGSQEGTKEVRQVSYAAKDDYEIVGCINISSTTDFGANSFLILMAVKDGKDVVLDKKYLSDYVGYRAGYDKNGSTRWSEFYGLSSGQFVTDFCYTSGFDTTRYVTTYSGMKVFKDYEALKAYAETGSLDGMVKDAELDKTWYLKNIKCIVTADDSPTSEAGADVTYIKFFWLTDNLQEGDLIEIKSHNYLKKIGGEKISGFHDFITYHNNVSALDDLFKDDEGKERASYTVGQYDAVKAWFNELENKPLIFKSYDTDIYYFRPYRNGKVGAWCKVTMGRNPLIEGSPYIEGVQIGDIDDDGNWIPDDDATEENGGDYGSDQGGNTIKPDPNNPFEGTNLAGIFKSFFDFMKDIPSLLGDLPALVNSIIGFLPAPVLGFIGLGVLVAIILRVVGR